MIGKPCQSIEDLFKELDFNESRKWSYIVLHMSETYDNPVTSQFESVRKYHKEEKHWAEIAYHLWLEEEQNKLVYKPGRSLKMDAAAHKGMNNVGLAICVCGNFDTEVPSLEKWEKTKDLVKALQAKFKIPREKVICHSETFTLLSIPIEKTCNGKLWKMDRFRLEL